MINIQPFRGTHPNPIIADYISKSAHVWHVAIDDDSIGFWGLITQSLLADRAYIWFDHNETNLKRHRLEFTRFSREVFKAMLSHYPTICGHCIDTRSMRWLGWVGAEFTNVRDNIFSFELRAK